jgi:anti-sigma B factor antagonist
MSFREPQFRLIDRVLTDGTAVVEVAGEIHVSTASQFGEHLKGVERDGCQALVLDLTAVEFIDSTGLGVLITSGRRLSRAGGRMAIVCANPTVLRLFEITGTDRTLDIRPELAPALALVQAPAAGSDAGIP